MVVGPSGETFRRNVEDILQSDSSPGHSLNTLASLAYSKLEPSGKAKPLWDRDMCNPNNHAPHLTTFFHFPVYNHGQHRSVCLFQHFIFGTFWNHQKPIEPMLLGSCICCWETQESCCVCGFDCTELVGIVGVVATYILLKWLGNLALRHVQAQRNATLWFSVWH